MLNFSTLNVCAASTLGSARSAAAAAYLMPAEVRIMPTSEGNGFAAGRRPRYQEYGTRPDATMTAAGASASAHSRTRAAAAPTAAGRLRRGRRLLRPHVVRRI